MLWSDLARCEGRFAIVLGSEEARERLNGFKHSQRRAVVSAIWRNFEISMYKGASYFAFQIVCRACAATILADETMTSSYSGTTEVGSRLTASHTGN